MSWRRFHQPDSTAKRSGSREAAGRGALEATGVAARGRQIALGHARSPQFLEGIEFD
jgi:hypothetical protein